MSRYCRTINEIRDAGREAARRSAAEQGLPEKITDPKLLERVAALLADHDADEQQQAA